MQIYAHHKFIWRATRLRRDSHLVRAAPRPETCAPAPARSVQRSLAFFLMRLAEQNFQPLGAGKLYGNRKGQIWDRIYFVHYCNYANWRIAHVQPHTQTHTRVPWKTLGIIAGRKFSKAANFFNLRNSF
jgi:hypothetical protein